MAQAGAALRVGLIGHPVSHSRSPEMQQAALDALGIPARYELWETPPDELEVRLAALRAPGMLGANVTIPYKLAVLPLLDAIAPEGEHMARAVNTIVREPTRDGGVRLVGHNTDIAGLVGAFREARIWPAGRRAVVLGAGGAAQAVAGLLAREGAAALTIATRRPDTAERLLADIAARQGQLRTEARALDLADAAGLAESLRTCDLLVNATSAGMGDPDACPIDPALVDRLPSGAFVLDIVYSPPETALLRAARRAGLAAANGLPMLLHQGAAAFELWTGRAAPIAVMRAALERG